MSFVIKGIKANKFLGSSSKGTWFCRVKECKMIASVEEMKHLDSIGELSWGRFGSEVCVTITPLCPIHGVPLDYNASEELIRLFLEVENQRQLALPMPRESSIHPHHPLEVCTL
jgi:hypothetical protein